MYCRRMENTIAAAIYTAFRFVTQSNSLVMVGLLHLMTLRITLSASEY